MDADLHALQRQVQESYDRLSLDLEATAARALELRQRSKVLLASAQASLEMSMDFVEYATGITIKRKGKK